MFAMSTEVARHAGAAGALAKAREAGFAAVELIPMMFGEHHGGKPSLPDDGEVAALRAALAAAGVRAVSAAAVFMPLRGRWVDEDKFVPAQYRDVISRASPEDYARYLTWLTRAAPALGVQTINCLTLPFADPDLDVMLARFVDGMRPVLDSAREHGVVVCVEHEGLCPLIRFEPGLRRLLAAVDHPAFGLTIDTANLFTAGWEPYPYAVRELRPWIRHVHLRGARLARPEDPAELRWFEHMDMLGAGRHTAYTTLRDGSVNVHGLLASLAGDGYRGVITFQPLARGARMAELAAIAKDDLEFVRSGVPG